VGHIVVKSSYVYRSVAPVVGLGLFTSDVWEFIVALWDHWEVALTGGFFAILSSWAGFHVRRSWGRWVFWSIAAFALISFTIAMRRKLSDQPQ
jgi:hypothetical protein